MASALDIATTVLEVGPTGKTNRTAKTVTAKLGAAAALPRKPGLYTLTPEQLLSVNIPHYSLNGNLEGYQQAFKLPQARAIARAMMEGRDLPVAEYSIGEDSVVNATDGQHRTIAAIIAGLPLDVRIKERSVVQQRQLYADQSKGRKPNKTTLILAGDGPYELYVLDALTSDAHPWSRIVSEFGSSARMSVPTMHSMLTAYVGNALSDDPRQSPSVIDRFDSEVADELATDVLAPFGTKTSNPLAWEAFRLRAIATAATLILRRSDDHAADLARWQKVMVRFPWREQSIHRRAPDMADALIAHWNKQLPHDSSRRARRR